MSLGELRQYPLGIVSSIVKPERELGLDLSRQQNKREMPIELEHIEQGHAGATSSSSLYIISFV